MKNILRSIITVVFVMFLLDGLHAQEYADPSKALESGKAPGLKAKDALSVKAGWFDYKKKI